MMSPRLFHVSEDPNIERFEPRPPKPVYSNLIEPVVWAVDIWRVVNYLLPRDCPRVTFYATSKSKPEDVERLLGTTAARHVVAVEWGWLERIRRTPLIVYELPSASFRVIDEGAGYYVSSEAVEPIGKKVIDDLILALAEADAELRLTPNLWPLRDEIVRSSLQYSCIRMSNAQERT